MKLAINWHTCVISTSGSENSFPLRLARGTAEEKSLTASDGDGKNSSNVNNVNSIYSWESSEVHSGLWHTNPSSSSAHRVLDSETYFWTRVELTYYATTLHLLMFNARCLSRDAICKVLNRDEMGMEIVCLLERFKKALSFTWDVQKYLEDFKIDEKVQTFKAQRTII